MSPQSAPLPLADPSHKGCQTASWARWQIQPARRRRRWDGGRQCVLRARLLPFRGGMGARDLCCCMRKINTWSPHALPVCATRLIQTSIHQPSLDSSSQHRSAWGSEHSHMGMREGPVCHEMSKYPSEPAAKTGSWVRLCLAAVNHHFQL